MGFAIMRFSVAISGYLKRLVWEREVAPLSTDGKVAACPLGGPNIGVREEFQARSDQAVARRRIGRIDRLRHPQSGDSSSFPSAIAVTREDRKIDRGSGEQP